jgi:hypothetical protein
LAIDEKKSRCSVVPFYGTLFCLRDNLDAVAMPSAILKSSMAALSMSNGCSTATGGEASR